MKQRTPRILGVDFTSAPGPRKAITAACGFLSGKILRIETIEHLESFAEFEALLARPGPWIGGFDFPFGLPRDAVRAFRWPAQWEQMVNHCARLGKPRFTERLNRDRISRPKGSRYRYRKGDRLAGSSPAVRLHQVPVGLMFFEGAPRLARSGVHIPILRKGDESRIALEAYPGYLAKKQLGILSYKSDERAKQSVERARNRQKIVDQICLGKPLGIKLSADQPLLESLVCDPAGDLLDSTICALQAAWGWKHRDANFGLPPQVDSIEGWIVSVN